MGCSGSMIEPVQTETFHQKFKEGRILGSGSFGQVRVAAYRQTEAECAVKIVDVRQRSQDGGCTGEINRKRQRSAKSEVAIWREIGKHENCVSLFDVFFEQSLYYMVMEKCECSVMDQIAKGPVIDDVELVGMVKGMLHGLAHVHQAGVVHRDVKPHNFLLGGSAGSTVKLCDFGLSAKLTDAEQLKGVYGTAPYMSPEMVSGKGHDQRTDMWSLGATVYVMVYGQLPYLPEDMSSTSVKQAILTDSPKLKFPERPFGSKSRLPLGAPSFVAALMQRAPLNRATAWEALDHHFLELDKAATANTTCPSTFAGLPELEFDEDGKQFSSQPFDVDTFCEEVSPVCKPQKRMEAMQQWNNSCSTRASTRLGESHSLAPESPFSALNFSPIGPISPWSRPASPWA